MTRYLFSPAADADMVGIWRYSATTWSPARADRYITEIVSVCSDLAVGRNKGRPIPGVDQKYCRASVGSHVVIYRPEPTQIVIVRILHARMYIATHLDD